MADPILMPKGLRLTEDGKPLTRDAQRYLGGIEELSKRPVVTLADMDFATLTTAQALAILAELDMSQLSATQQAAIAAAVFDNLDFSTLSGAQALAILGKLDFAQLAAVQAQAIAAELMADATAKAALVAGIAPNVVTPVKAWCRYSLTGGVLTVLGALNATLVRTAVGRVTVTFPTAMVDTNYAMVGSTKTTGVVPPLLYEQGRTTSTYDISCINGALNGVDPDLINLVFTR